jgi:hypothetical protein
MPPQLTLPNLAAYVGDLAGKVQSLMRPAQVMTAVAAGRRELGWEVGFLLKATANASASPILGITVNNDADFVATRAYILQVGANGAGAPVPPNITVQIRDSATGNTFARIPAAAWGIFIRPDLPASTVSPGKQIAAPLGWPAPYVMKKGSSVFFEITNPGNAYTFVGDLVVVLEGYRVYTAETDPVPDTLSGQVEPFVWNGVITVPNGLAAGVQILGQVAMPGLDQNRYVLKSGYIQAQTGVPNTVVGADGQTIHLSPDDVLQIQISDTYQQNKLWGRVSTPPSYGQFFPAKCFTVGGTGHPWAYPRFVQGTDTIFVTLVGDPAAWSAGNPGVIEVGLVGARIYG